VACNKGRERGRVNGPREGESGGRERRWNKMIVF